MLTKFHLAVFCYYCWTVPEVGPGVEPHMLARAGNGELQGGRPAQQHQRA